MTKENIQMELREVDAQLDQLEVELQNIELRMEKHELLQAELQNARRRFDASQNETQQRLHCIVEKTASFPMASRYLEGMQSLMTGTALSTATENLDIAVHLAQEAQEADKEKLYETRCRQNQAYERRNALYTAMICAETETDGKVWG